MTLIYHAQPTFFLAEPRDDALVRRNAVAVRFAGVRCLGQRIAERGIHTRVASVAELSLQPVVIGDAEVHYHVDLAHASVRREDWTSEIGSSHIGVIVGGDSKV